jgi:hypothetical protein
MSLQQTCNRHSESPRLSMVRPWEADCEFFERHEAHAVGRGQPRRGGNHNNFILIADQSKMPATKTLNLT